MSTLMVSRRLRHPWIDRRGDEVFVGRVTDDGMGVEIVGSDRTAVDAADLRDELLFQPRPWPDLIGRWPGDDVVDFLAKGTAPTISEVLAVSVDYIDALMEFPRREHSALVAAWALGTYFVRTAFTIFPRLWVGGERESGKTKLLTILQGIAWNALHVVDPTPAVLFRLAGEFRPTLLVDEAERLNSEDAREILAVVHQGYKLGGSVPRVEGKDHRRVELYDAFTPMALASVRGMNATTESRCIPLILQRGVDPARINAEVDPTAETFAQIRAGAYRLALMRWREVRAAAGEVVMPAWLTGRARELWRPLLGLALVVDQESGLGLGADLVALAREHVRERTAASPEVEALIGELRARLAGGEPIELRPLDLAEALRDRLGWRDRPSGEVVGGWLRRIGLRRARHTRAGSIYVIGAEDLEAIERRLGAPEEGGVTVVGGGGGDCHTITVTG